MWRYCAVNEWSLLTLVQWKLIRSAGIYLSFFSHLTYVWFFHDYFGLRFFAFTDEPNFLSRFCRCILLLKPRPLKYHHTVHSFALLLDFLSLPFE